MTAPADVGLPEPAPRRRHSSTPSTPAAQCPATPARPLCRVRLAFHRVRIRLCPEHRGVRDCPRRRLVRLQRANRNLHPLEQGQSGVVVAFFAWEFFYYAYFWTASGKTPGMQLLGVQVVGRDGSSVAPSAGSCERWRFR